MAAGFAGERQFTWRALAICILIALSVLGFGYPTAIIGTTLSQPSFLIYMDLIDATGLPTASATKWIGTMSGVYQVYLFFSVFYCQLMYLGGWCDWYRDWYLDYGPIRTKTGYDICQHSWSNWRNRLLCISKRYHVHCIPLLCRCWRLVDSLCL